MDGRDRAARCVAWLEQLHGDMGGDGGKRQLRNRCMHGNTVVVMDGLKKAAALLRWTGIP